MKTGKSIGLDRYATFPVRSSSSKSNRIESKRLACRMVGSHRRIAFDDLQAYAAKMRAGQKGALQRMADNARELCLDY